MVSWWDRIVVGVEAAERMQTHTRREPMRAKRERKRFRTGVKIVPKSILNQRKMEMGSRMHFGSVLGGPWEANGAKVPSKRTSLGDRFLQQIENRRCTNIKMMSETCR